jgi:hypothetical protein
MRAGERSAAGRMGPQSGAGRKPGKLGNAYG